VDHGSDSQFNFSHRQWLWVRSPKPSTENGRIDEAREEASKLCMKLLVVFDRSVIYGNSVKEVTDKVEAIKVCCSILDVIASSYSSTTLVERPDNSYTLKQKNRSKK
jgi:hypothetical protein